MAKTEHKWPKVYLKKIRLGAYFQDPRLVGLERILSQNSKEKRVSLKGNTRDGA